jgi:hypothetical protein
MVYDPRSSKRVTVYRATVPHSDQLWEVEYDAIADALHFACRDLREGRRQPIEILEDGVQVYDAEGIARACGQQQ